jgi:fatty-acid desaturase
VMAFGGTTAAQKGPLRWASHHRDHHRYSDSEPTHSPTQRGFFWSHVGWILCDKYARPSRPHPRLRHTRAGLPQQAGLIGSWALGIAST